MTDRLQEEAPPHTVNTGPGWYRLAALVRAALAISAVVYVVDLAGSWWAANQVAGWLDGTSTFTPSDVHRIDTFHHTTSALESVLLVVTGVLFICWSFQAYRRPIADESALTVGRGWAIAGWLVPFANLVVPYRVVQCLNRSTTTPPRPRSRLIGAWWALWIVFIVTPVVADAVINTAARPHGQVRIHHLHTVNVWAAVFAVPALADVVLAMLVVSQVTARMRRVADAAIDA